jgi:hypothetical protein
VRWFPHASQGEAPACFLEQNACKSLQNAAADDFSWRLSSAKPKLVILGCHLASLSRWVSCTGGFVVTHISYRFNGPSVSFDKFGYLP